MPSALQEDCVHRPNQAESLLAIIYLLSPHFELLILSLTSFPLVTYKSLLVVGLESHSVVFYFNFRGVYSLGNQIGHKIFQFIQQVYPELNEGPGVMLRQRHKNLYSFLICNIEAVFYV